jgi:hypothetical protein
MRQPARSPLFLIVPIHTEQIPESTLGVVQGRTPMKKLSALSVLAVAALFCAAPVSLQLSKEKGVSVSVDTADARIGRPLTPFSVAGANRRAYRRGYYGGAYRAYGYAPGVYAPRVYRRPYY